MGLYIQPLPRAAIYKSIQVRTEITLLIASFVSIINFFALPKISFLADHRRLVIDSPATSLATYLIVSLLRICRIIAELRTLLSAS